MKIPYLSRLPESRFLEYDSFDHINQNIESIWLLWR